MEVEADAFHFTMLDLPRLPYFCTRTKHLGWKQLKLGRGAAS